jgi:hypothetical protein
MSEARFVRFVKGRYWLTLTKTAENPYKVFQDRHEAKVRLVQHGVLRSVAENCLVEAYEGNIDPCVAVPGLTRAGSRGAPKR